MTARTQVKEFVVATSSNGNDWYPDWQTADIWAPTSSIEPLPVNSPWTFTVQWTGSDTGPAGIANFDVQVSDGSAGAWTDWRMATQARSGSFTGIGGHTYYFRARARDYAGNVEPWPANYGAVTTVESLPPVTAYSTALAMFMKQAQIIASSLPMITGS